MRVWRNLPKEGQAFEAEIVEGGEDAEKHVERPVHIHEEQRPSHESEFRPISIGSKHQTARQSIRDVLYSPITRRNHGSPPRLCRRDE
jgi:hypothetical protein